MRTSQAAPAGAALRPQGESALRLAQIPSPTRPGQQSRPDAFAALFASTRLARQAREDASQNAEQRGTEKPPEQQSKPVEKDASQTGFAKPAGPKSKSKSQRTDRRQYLTKDSGQKADASSTDNPPAREASGSDPVSSEPARRDQRPANSQDSKPIASDENEQAISEENPQAMPAVSTQQPGMVNPTASLPAGVATSGSSLAVTLHVPAASGGMGAPNTQLSDAQTPNSAAVASVGMPTGVNPTTTSDSTSGTGTDSAGAHMPGRTRSATGADDAGEGAKPAPADGTFDHVLQAAARTKSVMTTRSDRTALRGAQQIVRPAEPSAVADLARVLRSSARDGQSKMLIQLDPPELGQVRIDVRMNQQTLTVRMEAQTQAGHDALQSRLTELKSALEGQGIHVEQMDVTLRPQAPTGSPQEQALNQQQHAGEQGASSFGQPRQEHDAGSERPGTGGQQTTEWAGGETSAREMAGSADGLPWYSRQLNLVA